MTDWPADARVFSRPTSKAREKRPGDEVDPQPHALAVFYFFVCSHLFTNRKKILVSQPVNS